MPKSKQPKLKKGNYIIWGYDLYPFFKVHEIEAVSKRRNQIRVCSGPYSMDNDWQILTKKQGQALEIEHDQLLHDYNVAIKLVKDLYKSRLQHVFKEAKIKHPKKGYL